MIKNRTLHILNGEDMYNYFKKIRFLEKDLTVPFNEAMCYGSVSHNLFSYEFIKMRANVHHVTPDQYEEITIKPLQPLLSADFTHVGLWFDADMFCQINLLTILAWLDQNDYKGTIELTIVDEMYKPVSNIRLEAKGYFNLYKDVLIHKQNIDNVFPALLKKGIDLYLNYLNKDSDLMKYIEKHSHVSNIELVSSLIKEFSWYGLGDTQYLEIVNSHRQKIDKQQ